ncbi:hypothetical protein L0P88_05835 [Muricauda sp. SCSIO 64092]|uniref:hypothetical protein n=1 Tax=Allomuricauda sp. SCSIO 64092 TaxID=2908842 RepID=UPI001FF6AEBB|nr:hypothetical protein [Muricauda sp. SCSIO 64092]UOY08074.1 hypothetical protein L0P88_05835 [Muricauda sp. SCSIO 64092]
MKKIILTTTAIVLIVTSLNAQWTDNGASLTTTDNIGIGTSNPGAKLHVNNGNNSYGTILANADESSFSLYAKTITTQPINVESFRLGLKYNNDENNGYISFYRGGGTSGGFIGFATNGSERLRILTNGNVGIGTSSTGSHKLAVDGSIGAREIKVEATGWSDFVFEDDYELRTLEEVEEHISENGHLPEIPSEAEVTENGINLGEMNAKLLQKIEELTLYLIEQNKENQEQRKLIEELQKEVSDLKTE